jgi:hypothetical protein
MKALFFDAGPIITIVMSRLTDLLPKLKASFGGKFYITPAVKKELVDHPLNTKRFEFEALEVMKLLREGTLEIYDKIPVTKVKMLTKLANTSFKIKNKTMDIVQAGEMESVAAALETGSILVIDERTLRLFIEDAGKMEKLLEHRFKRDVTSSSTKLQDFQQQFKKLTIIRSIELICVGFKMGLLDSYIPKQKHGRAMVLDAALWSAKYNGCAVTPHEIAEIKQFLVP